MATKRAAKKTAEPAADDPAAEDPVEIPSPMTNTVTAHHSDPDKNGARNTIVEGWIDGLEANAILTIVAGDRAYGGGTATYGHFRTFLPYTEGPFEVWVGKQRVA